MANRGFRPGERLTRAGLNQKLNDAGKGRVHGPRVRERQGKTILADEEFIFLKITEVSSTGPKRYGWKEVHHNKDTGNWEDSPRTGTIDTDPAFEIAGAVLTSGNTVYRAERSRASGAWMIRSGGGSGSLDVKGKDMVLMILGTEAEYNDCPNAPPPSPGCWPAYAWAAYKVCGYTYTKLFDARDLGVWAMELNGGSTSSWRRFHPAFWGWDVYTDGQPNASDDCAGVRFISSGVGALSCICPDWLSSLKCLKISINYKTEAEVTCDNNGAVRCNCDSTFWSGFTSAMSGVWGTTQTSTICDVGGCFWQGENGPFGLSFFWEEIPRGEPECHWGPPTFDPCQPCDGFSRFGLSVNRSSASGGAPIGNLYSRYRIDALALRGLIENCSTGPLTMELVSHETNACPNVINWIKIECCSQQQINDCIAAETP